MKKKLIILGVFLSLFSIITGCGSVRWTFDRSITISNNTDDKFIDVYINGDKVVTKIKPGVTKNIAYYYYGIRYLNIIGNATDGKGTPVGISEKRIYIYDGIGYHSYNESIVFYNRDFRK